MRESITLTPAESEMLLRGGVVGRAAVATEEGPHIVPLNYAVVDGAVVLRTSADSRLASVPAGTALAFEVDHVDVVNQRGWSVVVHGPAEWLDDEAEIEQVDAVWPPRPWAAGDRRRYLRIRWERIDGRRIGTGWDLRSSMPTRRTL